MPKRTILITGCSDGGLGASLALALHKSGWSVLATARNPAKMSSMTSAGIETLTLDVLSDDSIKECVAEVAKLTGGSLDALLNNAGAGYSMPFTDVALPEAKQVFEINVWSLFSTTHAFLPLLLKSANPMIINNTSIVSVLGLPFQSVYNASKAAAAMITQNLRLELQPFGIRVIDLRTGGVKTNFFNNVGNNNLSTSLPSSSLYQVAHEKMERILSGVDIMEEGIDSSTWAAQVAADLNKANPPAKIWRGGNATIASWAPLIPSSYVDSRLKELSGVNEVKRKVREQKRSRS